MNPKNRQYSLPYNGTDPEWYIQEVEKRKRNVDHVYCEMPLDKMISHIRAGFFGADDNVEKYVGRYNYLLNCKKFLELSKGRFRRICPINAAYYLYKTKDEFLGFVKENYEAIVDYGIEGVILSDYRMAEALHALLPELEIQTSCNCYQWNLTQMEIWREKFNVKVFNPPREILRVPTRLKEMHDAGFKLKCLVNEGCLVGCPSSINHGMQAALNCLGTLSTCLQRGVGDVFRGSYILPRWQKHYDKYVDIYKIAGRGTGKLRPNYPFFAFDAYMKERNDIPLTELYAAGVVTGLRVRVPEEVARKITLDKVPDKLLVCECRNCRSCGLCDKVMKSYVPKMYWDRFYPPKNDYSSVVGG